MASSPPSAGTRPGANHLEQTLRRFWMRVTEGLQLNELWSQFEKDARSTYRFYSRDVEKAGPTEPEKHPVFRTIKLFFWAILEKLSPARRLLLLLALVLLFFPSGGFTYADKAGDIQVAEFDFHVWGGLLLLLLLTLEVADRVVMKRDLQIAKEIQNWLLPGAPPQVPGIEIAYVTRPANTVAGDYYDVFPRPGKTREDDRLLFAVADVAGKSIPAAMLMATLQASLKTLSATPCSLAELTASMNRYACTNSSGGQRFTTAFLAEYDPATRRLDYVNAGHNSPMLRRRNRAMERLEVGGLPLGIMPEAAYTSAQLELQSGDWLIIFTDGVVEAVNAGNDEYGETRLLAALEANVTLTPPQVLERILASLDAFVGNTPQHDDVTCLLIKAV
jgi:serine phosphatase RsbU (regulator of sigma subunit)